MTEATADRPRVAAAPGESLSLWAAGLLYLVLTLVAAWPLSRHPGSLGFPLGADTDLVVWILGWDAHAFLHQPFSIFDANIYYPERHTLAFAENLLGSALISSPVIWISGNPVLGLNIVMLITCALCGLGAYYLGRRVGMTALGALLTGTIFAFAPPHFGRLSQPHLNAVQWLPFTLASLHAYLDGGRRRNLWLAVAFFTLQALASGHGAVYATLCVAALLLYRVAFGEPIAPLRRLRDFGLVGAALILPTFLMILPYRAINRDLGLHRTLTPDWAPRPFNFISSNTHFHQYLTSFVPSLQINERANGVLFMGFLPLVLAFVAVFPRLRRRTAESREGAGAPGGGIDLAAGAAGSHRSGRAWRWLALALDLLIVAVLAFALYRALNGPFKIRWNRQVVFSAREAWRGWALAAALLGLRWWMWRRVPFQPLRWVMPVQRGVRLAAVRAASASRGAARGVARWYGAQRRNAALFYGLLAVGSFILTAPPPLGIWPRVYWLPGFNFVRVPARFTLITLLAVAVLAGLGFERLAAGLSSRKRRGLAVAGMLILALEFSVMPLKPVPYAVDIPDVDRWLDTLPKPFAVAEVPLAPPTNIGQFEKRQAIYMLHSMGHWQKTVHAFSGFRTPLHARLFDAMQGFPDENSLRALEEIKVDYVVVHTDYYPPGAWAPVESRLATYGTRLRLLHSAGAGRVYALLRR